MTKEQKKISYSNKIKARKYFGILGDNNLVLHHIDISLRHNDVERYIQWNPEDLIVMTRSEHVTLHRTGSTHSEETRRKISEGNKNKKFSEESRKKLSESMKQVVWSEERNKNVSDKLKGRKPAWTGKHWKLVDGKRVYY